MPSIVTETMTTLPPYQLTELKNGFGAEIRGLCLSNGASDDVFRLLEDAVTKYGVIMVRKTCLTDETHIALGRKFGELDDVTPYVKVGRKSRLKYDELFDVSNVEEDGSLVDPESPRGQANKGNLLFHVDSSFNPRRAGYSLLLVHELPPPRNGGGIALADTRTAYDELDPQIKTDLVENDYIAAHSIVHSKKLAAPEHFAHVDPLKYPVGRHHLIQRHEKSGRMNIYLAAHIHHIEGHNDSQKLFNKLFEHCTQDKFVVEYDWEDEGDLLIWDNTCTMHRALGGTFEGKYRRDMRRVTVHDSSRQAWGLNEHTDLRQGLP